MKYLVFISLVSLLWSKFNRIAEMNALKEKAAFHFQHKEYAQSAALCELLLNQYKETDESVRINLANSYFQSKQYNKAIYHFKIISNSKNPNLKSAAFLQLGVVYSSNNKKELGLNYFKEAMKALPSNEEARYNYELLKKESEKTQKETSPEKKKENKNGKNQTGSSTAEGSKKVEAKGHAKKKAPSNTQEGDEDEESLDLEGKGEDELQQKDNGTKETDALRSKRLSEMNISQRQAHMILKTMRNAEEQYIQQRKKIIPSKVETGKPDW